MHEIIDLPRRSVKCRNNQSFTVQFQQTTSGRRRLDIEAILLCCPPRTGPGSFASLSHSGDRCQGPSRLASEHGVRSEQVTRPARRVAERNQLPDLLASASSGCRDMRCSQQDLEQVPKHARRCPLASHDPSRLPTGGVLQTRCSTRYLGRCL